MNGPKSDVRVESVQLPTADIGRRGPQVAFVPKAAGSNRSKADNLFDHLVGTREQRCWHINSEHLGGLKVDHQLVFGRCLHR
jgi:hypothetical protein